MVMVGSGTQLTPLLGIDTIHQEVLMDTETRLLLKTHKTEGCWEWIGCRLKSGYGVMGVGGRQEYVHRIAYRLFVGNIDPGMTIDHQCHCRYCVNPDHLRMCSPLENTRNSILPKDNTSGFKGVTREKRCKDRWQARITVNYKQFHLGNFDTPELAHAAYCEAATRYHGEFANFG